MKALIKRAFALCGLEVSRLQSIDFEPFPIESPVQHNSKDRMNAFFSNPKQIEQYLDPSRLEFYRAVVELTREHSVIVSGKRVLDIGCGSGQLLALLHDDFPDSQYTGFDFSEEALKLARQTLPTGNFFSYDIYSTPVSGFDVVYCTEVLEHLLRPSAALINVLGSVAVGGTCILTVPNGRIDTYDGHINFWSPESWKEFLVKYQDCIQSLITGDMTHGRALFAVLRI